MQHSYDCPAARTAGPHTAHMMSCCVQQGLLSHIQSVLQKAHELLMHILSVISQIEFITPSVNMRLDLLAATMSILTPILEHYIAEDVLQVCSNRVQVGQ